MDSRHDHETTITVQHPHARIKWDLTVNVPTILSILGLAFTAISLMFSTYREFDTRLTRNTYDITALREKVSSIESSITSVRAENTAQMQTLRAEIRADLSDIKSTLKDITMGNRHPSP